MTLLNRSNSYTRRNSFKNGSSYADNVPSVYGNGNSNGNGYGNSNGNGYGNSHGNGADMGIPPAFMDDDATNRKKKPSGGRNFMIKFVIFMIVILASAYSLVSYHERKMMKSQLEKQDETMRELEIDLSMKFDSKVQKLSAENAQLKRQLEDVKKERVMIKNLQTENQQLVRQKDGYLEDIKVHNENIGKVSRLKDKMQANIVRSCKTAMLAKYGPGPHRLEMILRFDSHKGHDDVGKILIEMAPVEEHPHAAYWFLEQVRLKLYDGFSFHRNAGHVIQAGAAVNFLSDPKNPPSEKPFRDAGYHSLLFQEYSENFPHVKYTMGFAGRPGGPSFYINMMDNSKIHGPGGQRNHDDPSEADTCFAKVIEGFDVVDRIHKLPVEDGSYKALKDNVAIVSIRHT